MIQTKSAAVVYGLICLSRIKSAAINNEMVAGLARSRLGHSSVSMTLDVYSHVLPHIQDNATEKMANVMRVKP